MSVNAQGGTRPPSTPRSEFAESHTPAVGPLARASLEGLTALVTGASRGIGWAIAQELAARGAKLALAATNAALLEQRAQELRAQGRTASTHVLDVSDGQAAASAVKAAQETHGSLDILVNNAGLTRDGLVLRMSEADWDRVLDVNLKGAFHCCKAAARFMLKQRRGSIINVSSVVGLTGNAGQANYAASKAGLIGLTRSLALELADRGVRVNAIAPGFIESDMTAALAGPAREALLARIPLGRVGAAQDVAALAAFLAGPSSAYVTGQVLVVDGGLSL